VINKHDNCRKILQRHMRVSIKILIFSQCSLWLRKKVQKCITHRLSADRSDSNEKLSTTTKSRWYTFLIFYIEEMKFSKQIDAQVHRAAGKIARTVDSWLKDNWVTQENAQDYKIEYHNNFRKYENIYILKKNGQNIAKLKIRSFTQLTWTK
jgi:hypothetical protein